MVTLFISQQVTESRRKEAAFRKTEDYAKRHADLMAERSGALLRDRQTVEAKLEEDERTRTGGMSLLYAYVRTESMATEVVQFTQPYEPAAMLLSPSLSTVKQCFTIVYEAVGTPSVSVNLTSHGEDVSCVRIADELNEAVPPSSG
ncbi:hypothetical protein [Streptomyces sp. NPDC058620]|uniref:hypothetical protein n=1 Tax=Streptomyces sp. NPDC058620 TaxID=3346560 RepID=UPI0036501782